MLIAAGALLILLAWFVGPRRFVEGVLLTRASLDPVFTLTKLGGLDEMGVGAAVNLAVLVVAAGCVATRPRVSPGPALVLWLPLLVVCFVSTRFAPDPGAAVRLLMLLATHAAFCLLAVYMVRDLADLRRFLLLIVAGSIAPTLYAGLQLAMGWAMFEDGTRVFSSFPHPNIYAFYLMTILAVVLTLTAGPAFRLSPRLRRALVLYVPILLGLLLLTKTRSAWAGAGLILLTHGLLFDRRTLLYFLGLPVALLAVPELAERLADLQQGNTADAYEKLNSYAFRVLLWQGAMTWFWERPLFGWGLSSFGHYVAQFFPLPLDNDTIDSHSVYVQFLFETGVIGLAAYLWLYARIVAATLRLILHGERWAWMLLAMIAGYLSMAYSDNMLYYLVPTWYMWFVLGGACAVLRRRRAVRRRAPVLPLPA
ncbi:O-antigen ligase family protein [Methylobacterium terricola]|uniref:O-antigen ligase family protein n=1 Tax=Methylobacterium terricola TaxID=2583531 RepID=A0A5C4LGN9_9HYPH|nr:O-antigen ligase family protein [Methylobacterium terricola]TNC12387.1 O-antigen ligase family protein [Methylobacterium terricola]